MFKRIFSNILIFVIGISLLSCGGGGTQLSEGGIGGSGISQGAVTGYGSIIVNGVHFDTTGAVITKDGGVSETIVNDSDVENGLITNAINIGMVVTVKGSINDDGETGKAKTISYDDIIEGPIVGNPSSGMPINVLGQNVNVVDGVTVYTCDKSSYDICDLSGINGLGFDGLRDGQVIEVSGFIDQNGNITAAYIELKEDSYTRDTGTEEADVFELKGYVTTVMNDFHFTIGDLIIDTTNTGDTTGLDGMFVKAKGTFDGTSTLTTTTEAVEIDNDGFDIEDADKAELEGIVTATTGCTTTPCDFTLSGVTVRVDSNTTFTGDTVTVIDVGVKLEAEGTLQGGILHASKVEF